MRPLLRVNLSKIALVVGTMVVQSCAPAGKPVTDLSNQKTALPFTISSITAGGNNLSPNSTGVLYSQYSPLTMSGTCASTIAKVKIVVVPSGQASTQSSTSCTSGSFTWTQAITTENTYSLILTATDASLNAVAGIDPFTKTYVYDVTPPSSISFTSPTTGTTYNVNSGQTQFTISGKVGLDVVALNVPGPLVIPLTADPDQAHQDFSYSVHVAIGSTLDTLFVASDQAGNATASAFTIISNQGVYVPVAQVTAGGSVNASGLTILSTMGPSTGNVFNSNLQFVTGAAAIVGNAP